MISTLYGCPAASRRVVAVAAVLLEALERVVGLHLGLHLSLDGLEVGRGQWSRQVEVVVEAVADGGTDAQLGVGEQLKHGRRHDVRGRMPHRVERCVGTRIEQLRRGGADLISVDGHGPKEYRKPPVSLARLDRLEGLERLGAGRAVVDGAAQGGTEGILEGRVDAIRNTDR